MKRDLGSVSRRRAGLLNVLDVLVFDLVLKCHVLLIDFVENVEIAHGQ